MKSRRTRDPSFDDDWSMWDEPFRPDDTRGLSEDMERQDALVRRLRMALPLEKRMNVLVLPPRRIAPAPRDEVPNARTRAAMRQP